MTNLIAGQDCHLTVIYNPVAGQRRGRRFRAVLAALAARGIAVDLLETAGPGHATRLAQDLRERAVPPRLVVVAGGDGTINEVANGLAGGPVALGIVPLGTANVLALELGLPRDPAGIAATIAAGACRSIHLGRVDSALGARHFVMMAGVGYDAHVVAGVSPRLKRRVGKLAYVGEMVRQLRHFHFTPYRLAFDGAAPVEAASAIFANGRHYGGAFVCAPAADLAADRLEACLFGRGGRLAAIHYGVMLGLDRVPRLSSVTLQPFRRLAVTGPAGDPIQGDGDVIGRLPAEIRLADTTLLVAAPVRPLLTES
ncbi:diacylglycerol/lipid kinase family protein [Zavarzinia compransoris]|uniref:DAGKc domain-containing protein n=1 Tax=Zavarzinia compransoris TaxID=1264899 RepID=A0A317DY43_9PROT|nr:diacylglycerol kinase family protein [Zavarzinia compransoris]PWR18850.1 hypothetical protein DKG75_17900 [Zavarzinia compransoris]TDP48842.1 YegS/Rv2252/BmrU family lipid kinase [Zavarzinia compransoris]